jgi:Domain of unknown function (DUF4062)
MSASPQRKLRIMVSSTNFGIEDLLQQVYAVLDGFGYEVWMSFKGTLPVSSTGTAFDNCLEAVENCDAFLGIMTGRYGSGEGPGSLSITHQEVLKAIELDKLRWFLVHHHVTTARQLLKQFRFNPDGTPKNLTFEATPILSHIQVLEMYEDAIREDLALSDRKGNWVQSYMTPNDALLFINTQFRDPNRIWKLLEA